VIRVFARCEGISVRRLNSALFIDFDNVFISIGNIDRDAARAFGTLPQIWLDWLVDTVETPGFPENEMKERAFLIRRCYASPVTIERFRPYFARNAFSVIECPPVTRSGKNSADIYMVMDILDTLAAYPHIEEFVILSADADFMPVVTRLRAFDKRTVIYANGVTAAAYKSACDDMIVEGEFMELLRQNVELAPRVFEPQQRWNRGGAQDRRAQTFQVPAEPGPLVDDPQFAQEIVGAIREQVAGRDQPLPLAEVANALRARFGERFEQSRWAGAGSMSQFLRRNPIDGVAAVTRPPGFLYDPARYTPPAEEEGEGAGALDGVPAEVQALVDRITAGTDVPRLAPSVYTALFAAIAADVADRPYNLRDTNRGVRDRLDARGIRLIPAVVGFVLRGLEFQKHRFSPQDSAETLAAKFRRQVAFLCRGANIVLGEADNALLERWIGTSAAIPERPADTAREAPGHGTAIDADAAVEPAAETETRLPGLGEQPSDDPLAALHRLLAEMPDKPQRG